MLTYGRALARLQRILDVNSASQEQKSTALEKTVRSRESDGGYSMDISKVVFASDEASKSDIYDGFMKTYKALSADIRSQSSTRFVI